METVDAPRKRGRPPKAATKQIKIEVSNDDTSSEAAIKETIKSELSQSIEQVIQTESATKEKVNNSIISVEAPIVKRGRGRPPKNRTNIDAGHTLVKKEVDKQNDEEQPKRKRGRPPKVVTFAQTLLDNSANTTSKEIQQPKRKRGRPPKVLTLTQALLDSSVNAMDKGVQQPKRKRGRPPGKSNKVAKSVPVIRKDKSRGITSPLRYSPSPIRGNMIPSSSTEIPILHKRRRGRPTKAEVEARRLTLPKKPDSFRIVINTEKSPEKKRRKSPESSSPNRRRILSPANVPEITKNAAMAEIQAVYDKIPEEKLSKFHHINIQAMFRLLETSTDFIRHDSPRGEE